MQAELGEESMLAEQGVKGEVKEGRRGEGGSALRTDGWPLCVALAF